MLETSSRATFSSRVVNWARLYQHRVWRDTFSDRLAKLSQGRCWRFHRHRVWRDTFSDRVVNSARVYAGDFIRATFSDRPVNSARVYAGDFTRATFSDRLVNSARVYAGDFIRATFSDRLAKLSQGRCWRLPQHRVQRESALLTEWMTGPWKCHPGSGTKVRIWTHNCPVIIIIRRRRRIRKSDKLLFSEPERELLFDGGSGGHGTDVYYLLQTAFWRGSVKYAYVQFCVKCFELSQWCYSCCAIEVLYYIRSFNFFKLLLLNKSMLLLM